MSMITNKFDSMEDCCKWFSIMQKAGFDGFSCIEMDGKFYAEVHKYKN